MSGPIVKTAQGDYEGERLGQVDRFLGVPYAAAPVGDLRFRAPSPAPSHGGIRQATTAGPTVPQRSYPGVMNSLLTTVIIDGDESLNVSIWTPAGAATSPGSLPVIVWVHGGSLAHGSNAIDLYDGAAFARDGVVFVAINYRLGTEGFSVLEGADLNIGLQDQLAALNWVQQNIAEFGGDPGSVTAMGESAGAISIAGLLASPLSAGLFHRAIIQSGVPDARPTEAAGAISRATAKQLGIVATAAAFRAQTADALLDAQDAVTAGGNPFTGGLGFQIAIDGEVITENPLTAVRNGAGNAIPLLMGTTTEEYRLWFMPSGLINRIGWPLMLGAMMKFRIRPSTVRAYRRNRPGAPIGVIFGAIATDLLLRGPQSVIAAARPVGTTWLYEFAWQTKVHDLGACHALELPFVFDNLAADSAVRLTGSDAPQVLADAMHAAWVRFATTGDPGWKSWDASRPVQRFDVDSSLTNAPRSDELTPWLR